MKMGSLDCAKRGVSVDQGADLPCKRRATDGATMDDNYKRTDDNYTSETIIRSSLSLKRPMSTTGSQMVSP